MGTSEPMRLPTPLACPPDKDLDPRPLTLPYIGSTSSSPRRRCFLTQHRDMAIQAQKHHAVKAPRPFKIGLHVLQLISAAVPPASLSRDLPLTSTGGHRHSCLLHSPSATTRLTSHPPVHLRRDVGVSFRCPQRREPHPEGIRASHMVGRPYHLVRVGRRIAARSQPHRLSPPTSVSAMDRRQSIQLRERSILVHHQYPGVAVHATSWAGTTTMSALVMDASMSC